MIKEIIMKQPKKVRDQSYVLLERLHIPAKLRVRDVERDIPLEEVQGEITMEEALVLAIESGERPLETISDLLMKRGR